MYLLTKEHITPNMLSANNDKLSAVNGRLRPRKASIALPPTARSKSLRRSEGKTADFKTSKAKPSKNERKPERSVNKPEPPSSLDFLCPYCDKKFASKKSVSKHVGSSHSLPSSDVVCQFCSHAAGDPLEIMRHMFEAHHNRYFVCLDCQTRFTSSNELKEHKINLCRKLKPSTKSHRNSFCQSKEKDETKKIPSNKDDGQQRLEDDSGFKGIVIACELKPTQIEDPADIESNITTNLILPTNKNIVGSGTMVGKGPVLVIDDIQWNKRMAGNFSFHNSEADQILSRLGVVHRSPGTATAIPRSHTYKYIEESTKFEKCFDTVFYSKVASNVQENLEKFLDGSFNRTPLDPDSIIKTRKSKNLINTAEGFPILLSTKQFSRNVFGAYLPRAIAPKHKWKRDSLDNEKHIVSADQLLRDSHANNCIVTLVSSLDIWTQLCMRRKFENKYNNTSFNEKKTEKQHVVSNELKEILESRELPKRAPSDNKCERVAPRQVEGLEFPMSLGLRPSSSQPPPTPPPPALLSGEWVRPRCFVCCACGDHTRDPKALVNHLNSQHPTANVSHYDIAGELLCNDDTILKHLYVPSNQTPNRTRPLRGIRECTKCGKSISLEELHQHMLECAGDTPVVKRKCRYRPFGVRRRRPRMPDNAIRKKIRRNISKRKTRQQKKIRSRSRVRSEVGDAETIRKMIADLPAKRHRASESTVAASQHWNRKRDMTLNKLLRNRPALDNTKNIDKQHTQKGPKNSLKSDPKVKKKDNGNTSKNVQSNAVAMRPVRVASRILRKADLKRKNALRRSPRSANQPVESEKERQNSNKSIVCISSAVQTDELSLHASSDRVDVNRSRGRTSEHAGRSNSSSSTPRQSEGAGNNSANANTTNNNNNHQQETRPQIKHSIARLTATTVTHDKSVQFQPHFLVNQECSKSSSKPYLLAEPQVFYENDIMAARLDKPPLDNYNQRSPVDVYAFQRSKLSKPRKKLNDCIAMLKNKLVEPPPPLLPSYSMHQPVHGEPAIMPLNYAPLEMMTPLNMIADCHYDMRTSIPYAHANTNAVSIISAPLDLSGKRYSNDEYLSTEYETLDLSQKNFRHSHSYYPYPVSDEDVVVDLCMKSVQTPNIEESLDLSRRSKQFDESQISMISKPCESRSIEHAPMYEYDFNASEYNNHSMFHQSTDLVYPQQALDYNFENRTIMQPGMGYTRDLECERITETNILTKNTISPNIDKNVAMQLKADHHINKKIGEYNTNVQPSAPVALDQLKGDVAATATLEKDNKSQFKAAVEDAAKKIALLPKEIVEILGKMPTDHRNQLLDVLPQYMGCNTSVKQLKLVVDINPEALISPMGINTLQSASTEIATQTLTSSVISASTSNVIDIEKRPIESVKENMQKNPAITENIRVDIQGPPISCGVVAQDPTLLQNSGLNKDISTASTADKPKEIKEKTASSLRAVRIKTSSQRRRTQNALEIKPTDHVPILGQPCLTTLQQNVLIQQAEVSSTQHSAISADSLKRFPSHEIGNLQRNPLHESDSLKIIETDQNKQASVSIANDSTCCEIPSMLEKVEHNVKEPINNDVLPKLPSKTDMIKNNEAGNAISDGDSDDDVTLAVIVKLKMAECQKPVDAKEQSDPPSRQKKKKKTKKPINNDDCNIDIDSENNKDTTTSFGTLENVSKETVTGIEEPDVDVNKIAAASETLSFYQGKKIRTRTTRSSKKEEQPDGFEQTPMQNQNEDTFYNIQNKENNDQTHTNVDMHLTNSEHIDIHSIPRNDINVKKDSEPPLAKVTQVSCQTLDTHQSHTEKIKPEDDIVKSKSIPKKKIKEKNICKPKTIQLQSDATKCIETQVKEHIDINIANINLPNNSTLNETKDIDAVNSLSSTPKVVEKSSVYNYNKPDDDQDIVMSENSLAKCDDSTQLKTKSMSKPQSNKNLRRSRRGKSEINELQAPNSTRLDSRPMLLSDSNDYDGDEKGCSDSYEELIDPPVLSKKILTDNEVYELSSNFKSSNKEIVEDFETKCKKNINICNKTKYSKKNKTVSVFELQIKTSEISQNVSLANIKEKEKTEKHSALVETISPTTTIPVCNLFHADNQKDNSTETMDNIAITDQNKLMKQKKKSKSVGKRKEKSRRSKFNKNHTKNMEQSSLDDPTPSEKPNLLVVSDTKKDYLTMSPTETRKSTTCYNLSKESAVTRSKSSLSKSEDGNSINYDPYDIDQEDNLLEKISPLKKVASNRKSLSEELLPKKMQKASESSNDFIHKKSTIMITSLSDSDDSSKSDVPLKKLFDEKLERKNKDIKSVNNEAEEQELTCETNAPPSTLSENESLRSEQFMESFGFFSERRPRKSNIIAAKKISETFQNDDIHHGDDERPIENINTENYVSSIITGDFPIKCSIYCNSRKNRRGRKRKPSKDVTFSYCSLCEKAFRRPDNYLRHIMSYIHLTNVLQKEMHYDVEPIQEQPNCLIVYRQHLERIKRLTDKIKKKNKKLGITASPPKFELPSLAEIMEEAKMHTYTSPSVERRGLSRDEALFIDCCELLKESHKTEPVETVTLDTGVSEHMEVINPIEKMISEDRADSKSDGDVDSITAKTILESEEVRNLENDLLCGLKEAAAKRQLEMNNQIQSPNSQSLDNFDLDLDTEPATLDHRSVVENMFQPPVIEEVTAKRSSPKKIDSCSEEINIVVKKPKKSKTKVTTEIAVNIYEDKFDKIKRKCRSQAAAAKAAPAIIEPNTSSTIKKKSETKKIKKTHKNVKQSTIPTKGALKGFECMKLSESVDNASSSEPGYELTPPSKRKKSSHSSKKERKEPFKRSSEVHCSNVLPRTRADIYEFMDNDDSDAFHFRRSLTKDKFKTFKDTPSTSRADPMQQAYNSSASGSDVDDFVYMSDDYLCSADETENSLLSSEPSGNCKINESKKHPKRKEALEKNAVMGKIFKHNAVRNERKPSSSSKETTKASKANLDQLFDSLLEDEPNSSMLKDDADFPSSNRALSPAVVVAVPTVSTADSRSRDDSIFNSPPREQTTKRKKSTQNKKGKQKRSKIHVEEAMEGTTHKKSKRRFSGDDKVLKESTYVVAQHRARRACAVGKQNVLAETWSSESESDSPRTNAADAAAHARKKRSKKNKHSAARQPKHVSFGKHEKDSRAADDDGGSEHTTESNEKRNRRESRGRSRSEISYFSSSEGEEAHPQQHGWIVGNSHKKLVTMLAHAKGRKRDDKRSYID